MCCKLCHVGLPYVRSHHFGISSWTCFLTIYCRVIQNYPGLQILPPLWFCLWPASCILLWVFEKHHGASSWIFLIFILPTISLSRSFTLNKEHNMTHLSFLPIYNKACLSSDAHFWALIRMSFVVIISTSILVPNIFSKKTETFWIPLAFWVLTRFILSLSLRQFRHSLAWTPKFSDLSVIKFIVILVFCLFLAFLNS